MPAANAAQRTRRAQLDMAIVERTVENGGRQIVCEFWDDFPRAVRMGGVLAPSNPGLPHRRRIFRGQRDRNWRLASVWDRSLIWKQERGQRVTGQEFIVRDRKLA